MYTNQVAALAAMSNKDGANPAYVLAGGGNTSFKSDEHLWVKGSGTSLATIRGEDFVVLEEVILEVQAQYDRLVELTGKKPYMVEAHAVPSNNFNKAIAIVAQRNGVESMKFDMETKRPMIGKYAMKFSMDSGNPDYDPFESFKKAASQEMAEDECALMVLHPGYVDKYIYDTSYITQGRALEVAFAIDPAVPQWCKENDVQLMTYDML